MAKGWVFDALVVVRNYTSIFRVDELDQTVDKVSKVGKKLRVVFGDEVFPDELGVSSLRARGKKVVTPDLITQEVSISVLGRQVKGIYTLGGMPVSCALFPNTPTPLLFENLPPSYCKYSVVLI